LKREARELKRLQAAENKGLAGSGWISDRRNGFADLVGGGTEFAATIVNDSMGAENYGSVIH
jgi:hypothetical protein